MGPCVGKLVAVLLLVLLLRNLPHHLACHGLTFRVLSWNVLAPIHAPASKYPWTDPSHLQWRYRASRIAEFLRHERADVVCLQEVQLGECWEELYRNTRLDALYECCVLQNVTRGHPVANAILIRRGNDDGGPLSSATIRAVESRSRALIVVLEIGSTGSAGNDSRYVALANVHLEAGMDHEQDETRFYQLQSLMKRINRHCQELMKVPPTLEQDSSPGAVTGTDISTTATNATPRPSPSIILMGDWNMLPHSPLYQLLSTGRLNDPMHLHRQLQLPVPLLPLRDAFAPQFGNRRTHASGTDRYAGTYAGGSVLDYVWVSSDVTVQERWVQQVPLVAEHEGGGCRSEIRTAQRRRQGRRFFRWPSSHHPSDHLAIGATLQL